MGFMQPQIQFGNWYQCETKNGSEIVEADLVGDNPTKEDFRLYCEGDVLEFELLKEKYGARMSAPGFTDCTEWSVFDTEDEAKEYLKNEYSDDED